MSDRSDAIAIIVEECRCEPFEAEIAWTRILGLTNAAVLQRMDEVIALARSVQHTPHSWWVSPPIYDLFRAASEERPLRHRGLPIIVHDEWSWGWMLATRPPHEFALVKPFDAQGIEARQGGDAPSFGPLTNTTIGGAAPSSDESPVPKGCAQNLSRRKPRGSSHDQ